RVHTLLVELLGDVRNRVAIARTIMAAIENDDERRALGHAVEQTGGGGHASEHSFAGDKGWHRRSPINELTVLGFDGKLPQITFRGRDVVAAARNERAVLHPQHIGRVCAREMSSQGGSDGESEANSHYNSLLAANRVSDCRGRSTARSCGRSIVAV